ncbi:MAG: hypothetical protein HY690_18560 [Chloroflexi bacterium]|nr:hypothetical protein [Chloroflexota bacterium]
MAQYHVTLGGQGLILNLKAYEKRPATPFAQKLATGDRTYDDLTHDQVMVESDWSGGDGQLVRDPAQPGRYRAGQGVDGYGERGALRLGRTLATSYTSPETGLRCLASFRGKLYAGAEASGKIYRYDGAAWAQAFDLGAGSAGVTTLVEYGGKLYAANASNGQVASTGDGTTWSYPAFTVAGASGIHALAVLAAGGALRLYVVADEVLNVTLAARVFYWDGSLLSGEQFGLLERWCRAAAVLGSRLYVFGAETQDQEHGAIYSFNGTSWSLERHLPDNYVTAAAPFGADLSLGMARGGEVYRYNGSTLELLRTLSASGPLCGLFPFGGALWASAYTPALGVYLVRFDGQAWSIPHEGASGTAALGLAAYQGTLFLGTRAAASAAIHKVDTSAYRLSGLLETSLFDARLPSVDKVFRALTANHAPLAAGQSIEVQYRLEDAGAWISLGTSSVVGATSATFAFPGNVVGKLIAFRVLLATADPATSPALYDLALRYVLAPDAKREWELETLLEGTPELPLLRLDGTPEPLAGAQLSASLWTRLATKGVQSYVDLDGTSYTVWLTDLRERVSQLSQRTGYQTVARLRLLEC